VALADLLRSLERDATAELRAIDEAGAAEAARLDAETARRRTERLATTVAELTATRAATDELALAAARGHARGRELTARAAMLARAREAVRAALPAALATEPRLGEAVVAAALGATGDEAGVLRCAPAIVAAARAAAPPAIRVEPDPALATGAVIELASGTRIDATLDALLTRTWPALACEALARAR